MLFSRGGGGINLWLGGGGGVDKNLLGESAGGGGADYEWLCQQSIIYSHLGVLGSHDDEYGFEGTNYLGVKDASEVWFFWNLAVCKCTSAKNNI